MEVFFMKQTVKTSRAAGQLEKMFRALNTRFFDGKLPEPVITLKKTPGAYGHITCGKTWTAGTEQRHEINISTATLDRPIEETTATLLHEMCHLYNMVNGIKDTTFILSKTPAVAIPTTTNASRKRQNLMALSLSIIQSMAGRSQAQVLNCWTSSSCKVGRLSR